jgi:hypothetical protein
VTILSKLSSSIEGAGNGVFMTCGGILLIIGLLIGATWLGDQLNSGWPLWVAGVLILALIGWRLLELWVQRRSFKQFDASMESVYRASAAREATRTVLTEHRRQVEGGRWANFLFVRYSDGSREWVVNYDTPLLPDAQERASERRIVEELNDQWRRSQG